MKFDDIAAALAKVKLSTECPVLNLRCDQRRAELQQRTVDLIDYPENRPRKTAMLSGTESLAVFDSNLKNAQLELSILDDLQMQIASTERTLLTGELKKQIPAAIRELSSKQKTVLKQFEQFKATLEDWNQSMNIIGEFEKAGIGFPFNDERLLELSQLREQLFALPILSVPTPSDPATHPLSFPYHWTRQGFEEGNTQRRRKLVRPAEPVQGELPKAPKLGLSRFSFR